jgi:hypothetical protein
MGIARKGTVTICILKKQGQRIKASVELKKWLGVEDNRIGDLKLAVLQLVA